MRKRRVVIIGGGFGGLACAKALRKFDGEVILVDRTNHHLFQPLLYQVATAGLSGSDIAQPIRSLVREQRNISVHMASAVRIDPIAKSVTFDWQQYTLAYDYLVIALGVTNNWFGNDGWAKYAFGLKSLDDAYRIRDHVLAAFERAENLPDDAADRAKALTIVVVGGGPTGVEMAGACIELARRALKPDFHLANLSEAKVILIDASPRLLSTFDPELSARAKRDLEAMGVEVRTATKVELIGDGVVVAGGQTIRAATIIWSAGVKAPAITGDLRAVVQLDRSGRVVVGTDCRARAPEAKSQVVSAAGPASGVPGAAQADLPSDSIFAVGDVASMVDGAGHPVPGLVQGALQTGVHAAKVILADSRGGRAAAAEIPPFIYNNKGSMATIGRNKAVAQIGSFKCGGLIAWMLWLGVHLIFLIDLRSKVSVLIKWFSAYLFYRPSNRLIGVHAGFGEALAVVPAAGVPAQSPSVPSASGVLQPVPANQVH